MPKTPKQGERVLMCEHYAEEMKKGQLFSKGANVAYNKGGVLFETVKAGKVEVFHFVIFCDKHDGRVPREKLFPARWGVIH